MGEKMESAMKGKFWKVLACALAVVACLALAACGGNSGGSSSAAGSASGSSATAESSAAPADPAEKFVGDWKLAGAEMEGLTVVGDFSGLASLIGEELSFKLALAADGTGTAAYNDETVDVTWKTTGDDAIAITPASDDADIDDLTATYDEGVLTIAGMDDGEFDGNMYLSADGTLPGAREITSANATDITSESDLVGAWQLSGMNLMGMSMYGDADDLADQIGDESYTTLEVNSDGTATLMGEDATWTVGASGAAISIEGADVPVKSLDGNLMVDVGSLMSAVGVDMDLIMVFSK